MQTIHKIVAAAVVVPLALVPAAWSFANRSADDAETAQAFERLAASRAASATDAAPASRDQRDNNTTPTGTPPPRKVLPGSYIVSLKPQVRTQAREQATLVQRIATKRGTVRRILPHVGAMVVSMDATAASAVEADPDVASVEPNVMVRTQTSQANPTWALDRIDQRERKLDHRYQATGSGKGVTAYVLDTGINLGHTEFTGRLRPGYSVVGQPTEVEDTCNGHGTHVAGALGGTTYGVAKEVSLVPVKVLGCDGSGNTGDIISAMNWVIAQAERTPGPAVANLSIGGNPSDSMDRAIKEMVKAGIVVTVAAGNGATNACQISPARVPEAITVGASTADDRRDVNSNFGGCIDLFAPGTSITSAWIGGPGATRTNSGTSMASPHVAGAAALYLERNPRASVSDVAAAIIEGGTRGKLNGIGAGSPDVLLHTGFVGEPHPTPTTSSPSPTTPAPSPTTSDVEPLPDLKPTPTSTPTPSAPATVLECGEMSVGHAERGKLALLSRFQLEEAAAVKGCLHSPKGVDFAFFLMKWNGYFWEVVQARRGTEPTKAIEQKLTPGSYRWVLASPQGPGDYVFTRSH